MKIKKYWMMLAIALVSLCTVSCGGDDDTTNEFPVNNQVNTAIKTIFPKARLDSISSYDDFGNIKIKYNGDYLTEYGEYYDDGRIHDGVFYRLKWSKNEVEFYAANQDTPSMRVVLGSNGFAKECLNADGSVRHTFEYDEEGHLTKYNVDNAAVYETPDYVVCQWENGNMVKATEYFYKENGNSRDGYCEYNFTYSSIANKAALMPGLRGYDWLGWIAPEYLTAMHYAGLLGKGTNNLVSASSNRYDNGQSNQKYAYQYKMGNGLVKSCSDGYHYDYYFYTNISDDESQLDTESAKFVGKWEGRGPIGSDHNIKSVPQGVWEFNSDGTYYWEAYSNISGYATTDAGNWHYNAQSKMLITDSQYSINWQVLDITDNTWTGIMSYESTNCTYRRLSE